MTQIRQRFGMARVQKAKEAFERFLVLLPHETPGNKRKIAKWAAEQNNDYTHHQQEIRAEREG